MPAIKALRRAFVHLAVLGGALNAERRDIGRASFEVAMNEILIEAFRHKHWAMKTLIAACQNRSMDELTRPGPRFGSILATLNHIVLADARYLASLGGGRADW